MTARRGARFVVLALVGVAWCLDAATVVRVSEQAGAIDGLWQVLDLEDLAREPVRTLWLSHAFPPLFNAVIALLLWMRVDPYVGLVAVHAGCTLLATGIVYSLVQRETGHRWLAAVTALVYAFAPSTLYFLAQPLYGSMTAALFAVLVYAVATAHERPAQSLAAFAFAVTALTLLRAFFTWAHVILFCGLFAARVWRQRTPATVPVLLLTCLVAFALPVKNLVLHGFFGSSSQAVFSLLKGVGLTTDPDLGGNPNAHEVRAAFPDLVCGGRESAQDRDPLKANGNPNFNACEVMTFGTTQWRHLVRAYEPASHWRRVRSHVGMYLSRAVSATDLTESILPPRSLRISLAVYDGAFLTTHVRPGMDVRVLWPIVLLAGAILAAVRRSPTLLCLLGTIAVHALTHTLTDGNEANRYVFDIEALWYVLAGVVVASCWNDGRALVARWRVAAL